MTGFGVGGVCTEGVKICEITRVDVAKDNGGGGEGDDPGDVLDDSWGSAIGDVEETEGLTGEGMERDDICGKVGLLTTCVVLVATSIGLLVEDC